MTVAVDVDSRRATTDIRPLSNAEHGDEEGLIVNLHPEFSVPEDQAHSDRAFPWLQKTQSIAEIQHQMLPDDAGFKSLEDALKFSHGIQSPIDGWTKIKKAWSLTNNGRSDLAKKYLDDYEDHHFDSPAELPHVLFHFCAKFLGPINRTIFENAATHLAEVRKLNSVEFERFRRFYIRSWHSEHLARHFDTLSEYFKDFSEFSQTLMMAQYNLPIPENDRATSSAFKRTKLFYGNTFEAISSNFSTLACINNVGNGRRFDQFEKMDLKKYLTINKANRANPFKDTAAFNEFANSIDTTLRNASHHGSMKINNSSGVITYRSGGTGKERRITYAQYLLECNNLLTRLLALLMVELALAFDD